jgi:predicted GIY-YIG superfamily endonuclease
MDGLVYLLHFARPLSERHTCQHYLGWCLDLNERLAAHRAGRGARLTQVAVERGIGFEVVRTWVGSRTFERYLKNGKRGPKLCPMCYPSRRQGVAAEQLALPLFDDTEPWPADFEFPEPPLTARCWAEIAYEQAARRLSLPLVLAGGGDICEDIPY